MGTGWLTTTEKFEKNLSGIWKLVSSESSRTEKISVIPPSGGSIDQIEVVVEETAGGETVATHRYDTQGRKKSTVDGDRTVLTGKSWKFYEYDEYSGYNVYSPYGDTPFPGENWDPSLSALDGIRRESISQSSTSTSIGVASIGLISLGTSSQSSYPEGSYAEISSTSSNQGTSSSISITDSDFVFKGFRGKTLKEDDGRGGITLHQYTRGTIGASGFTANANGVDLMEISTRGTGNNSHPELQLYDSDLLVLHPTSVGASFPNAVTRDVRVSDAKGRTVYTATQVLDGAGYGIGTESVFTYTPIPNQEGEIVTETKDGRVVSETSSLDDGSQEQHVDEAGNVRVTLRDLLGRVTSETMPGDNGGTIIRSYVYDGLTTEITTTGGVLSLTTSETRDLRGRVVSSTDETGAATSYAYTDGGRTTTITRPGGTTEVTTNYLDGTFKERSGTGAIREFVSYEIISSGSEVTKHSSGPATSGHGARWTVTTTDMKGRTVSVRRPGPPNETGSGRQADVTETYSYNSSTGRLAYITSSARPGLYQVMEQDFLGDSSASGTATDSGALTAASNDRFSSSLTTYEKRGIRFWRVTTTKTYVSGSIPLTTSSAVCLWTGDGEISESTDAANVKTTQTTTYNPATQTVVTTAVNPLQGTTTETTIDSFLKTRAIPGAAQSESFDYDGLGRQIRHTDVRNAKTKTIYNHLGQVERVVDHVGQFTAYTYYPANHPSAGLVRTSRESAGKVSETTYDSLGRVSALSGNAAYPVSYTYDDFGDQKTLTTYGAETAITTWVIDPPTGLRLEKKYQGQATGVKYSYYGDGRLASRTWRRSSIRTDYGYSSFGDLHSINYSDNTPDVSFSNFDRLGRPTTVTEGGIATTLAYDLLTGEMSTTYPANHGFLPNIVVAMKSPNSGRPSGYTLSQGTTSVDNVTYGYSETTGMLDELSSGNHTVGYGYYPGTGILRDTTHTVTGGGTPRIETRHVDLAGRTTGVVTTVPDGSGRRIAASAGYKFDDQGLRTRLTREDGTTWNFGYNDRAEVTSGKKRLANGKLAAGLQFGYEYDAIGNRKWAKSGGNSSGQNQRTVSYTPNALNQYSSISTPGSFDLLVRSPNTVSVLADGQNVPVESAGAFHRAEISTTDTNGAWINLATSSPAGQNTTTGHRWVPPAVFSPIYDDDGSLTNDGRWTYIWDAENRLISQTTTPLAAAAGVPRIKLENTYDWNSRRIQKKISSSTNGTTWNPVSDERFLYHGWNPVAIFNASGTTLTLKQTCLWGLDLSGTLQGAGGVGGLLSVTLNSQPSTLNYLPSYDGNGNIVAWTAANGDILQRIDYDPFGNVVTREGIAGFEAPAWGFSTKYQDKETGLLYYGYRFYDPVNGRWPSRDPIEERGGINLYAFIRNNPIGLIDKWGLSELSAKQYRIFIESRLNGGVTNIDEVWRDVLNHYLSNDPEDDCIWDCEDDMEEIIEAFYKIFSDQNGRFNHGRRVNAGIHTGDGSAVSHFFGGASYEGSFEFGDSAQDFFEWLGDSRGDWLSDTAYAYAGADFSDYFDTWREGDCRKRVKEFTTGTKSFTGLLGPTVPANTEQGIRDFRNAYRARLNK